jgi:hypothetical protein
MQRTDDVRITRNVDREITGNVDHDLIDGAGECVRGPIVGIVPGIGTGTAIPSDNRQEQAVFQRLVKTRISTF